MKYIVVVFFLLYSVVVLAETTLKFQEISKDRYLYVLESSENLEESVAKNLVLEKAMEACNGAEPKLGQYRFKDNEAVSPEAPDTNNFYILEQEVFCVSGNQTEQPDTPQLTASEESELKTKVSKLTDQFFTNLENEQYPLAYQQLANSMKTAPESVWSEERNKVFSSSGTLVDRNIWRVSIYIDPPSAPNKGIYVATDFDQSYENIPIYCGYLVWYKFEDGFRIIREESGKIESELMKKIKAEEIGLVKNKLGCKPL